MNEAIETINSPVWWLTVVLGGIVINLISSLLKSFGIRQWGKINKNIKEKSTRKNTELRKKLVEYIKNPITLQIYLNQLTINCLSGGVLVLAGYFALMTSAYILGSKYPEQFWEWQLGFREMSINDTIMYYLSLVISSLSFFFGLDKITQAKYRHRVFLQILKEEK